MTKQEAKRLHGLGFAVINLHPRSKAPVGNAWQSGPRKTLAEFLGAHAKSNNLGVRLGKASRFDDGTYLAVIDCDVKGTDKKYEKEMAAKLRALFPKLPASVPSVISGRGNGSCHLYVRTKQPAAPKRRAQSSEIVKVSMPSVSKFSKRELEELTEAERAKGIHLRPAWEISVMGEGQQVVLPPSVHPDSGRAYQWGADFKRVKEIPVIDADAVTPSKPAAGTLEAFKPVKVDLSRLPKETLALIGTGDGCEDRSAALLVVAMQMKRAKYSDAEILTTLTDRTTYLGECAYEHRQTDSRTNAAAWVRKYTLDKAAKETDAAADFADLAEIEALPELSEEEAEKQSADLFVERDWRDCISRGGKGGDGPPKVTLRNIKLIIKGEAGTGVFRFDEFAGTEVYGKVAPWGGVVGAEIRDIDSILIKDWLSKRWKFEPAVTLINESIAKIAHGNRFHPVRDWLDGLAWDGVPRIDSWLTAYMSAEGPAEYLSAVGRKVLTAMVARIYEPGRKFDNVLILEGKQGVGKSTLLRYLVGDDWFTDASINVKEKDGILTLRSRWLIEMGELTAFQHSDSESLKGFVSRTEDRIRAPYGKRIESYPRQCVFVGTTNQDDYLKDVSGNRRFWPVRVGKCHFDNVRRDREQLFAEAALSYQMGEPLYLERGDLEAAAAAEQTARVQSDAWVEVFAKFLEGERNRKAGESEFPISGFSINDLFQPGGPLAELRDDRAAQMRAGDCLRRLGYERKKTTRYGSSTYVWKRPQGRNSSYLEVGTPKIKSSYLLPVPTSKMGQVGTPKEL